MWPMPPPRATAAVESSDDDEKVFSQLRRRRKAARRSNLFIDAVASVDREDGKAHDDEDGFYADPTIEGLIVYINFF